MDNLIDIFTLFLAGGCGYIVLRTAYDELFQRRKPDQAQLYRKLLRTEDRSVLHLGRIISTVSRLTPAQKKDLFQRLTIAHRMRDDLQKYGDL